MIDYIIILPLMLVFVHAIIQLFYTYIFRGVFKADSIMINFLNTLIFCYTTYILYEEIGERGTGLVLAIIAFVIFNIIFFKTAANRITVYNGTLRETVELIEERLEQEGIPFSKNEFSLLSDLVKFEINGGREYIEVKYKKSRLNEDYNYTMTIKSKLKERGTLLEDIILDLRDMRRDRTFKRRLLVEFSILAISLIFTIFFFKNIIL